MRAQEKDGTEAAFQKVVGAVTCEQPKKAFVGGLVWLQLC
jgi:hypothetical protein